MVLNLHTCTVCYVWVYWAVSELLHFSITEKAAIRRSGVAARAEPGARACSARGGTLAPRQPVRPTTVD